MPERPDLAQLLAESRWLRALARRLVAEGIDAEDLAQDTLAAALSHPPRTDRPLRGWLATVLRRRLTDHRREEGARSAREQASSRGEALPATLDVIAKAEQQRLLVDAVLALDEPGRTTVLLRFFENLPPRAIGKRMRVPVATVHSRLQRALARLREDLDRSHGRSSWLGALGPLTRGPVHLTHWTAGVSLVNGTLKGIVAAVALAAVACWLWPTEWSAQPPEAPVAAPTEVQADAPGTAGRTATELEAGPGRERVAGAARPAADRAPTMPAPGKSPALRGRVLDLEGHAVADVRLGWEGPGSDSGAHEFGTSAADGRFAVELPASASAIVSVDPRWSSVLPGSARIAPTNEASLLVAPRLDLGGRVVDEDGAPLAEVEIGVHVSQHLGAELGILLDFSLSRAWRTRTDAEGRFALADVPSLAHAALHATRAGYLPRIEPLPSVPDGSLLFVLERPRDAAGLVRGVVLDPAGASVAGARISAGAEVATSDARGEFALEIAGRDLLPRLVALAEGWQPGVFEPELVAGKPLWPARAVLQLGQAPLEIRGRVLGPDRAPRPGIRVWIVDPLLVGNADGDVLLAETLLSGELGRFWNYQTTDADGRFTIRGLRERAYAVAALDPRTLARADAARVAAGSAGLELVLAGDLFERVRGRVVARDGTGISGASVSVQRPVLEVNVPGGTRDEWADGEAVKSGTDGWYELREVPRAGATIHAWGDAILFAGRQLRSDSDTEHFDVQVDRRVHLQVELDPPLERADTLQVLDERGTAMLLRVMRGETAFTNRKAALENGRSQVLSLGEGARELVFLRQGVEVGRLPARLVPGPIQTLRW